MSPLTPTPTPTPTPAVWLGAGDIANCAVLDYAEATAKLLDLEAGTVFTLGDNAYDRGTQAEYENCYGPTWGRHKDRTRPTPGNHEYLTAGAVPYYQYFGSKAGPAGRGYYSYDLGAWHIISLNSNVPAEEGSAQFEWLKDDLALHQSGCAAGYWHYPTFSSGYDGNMLQMRAIWRLLYLNSVELVLSGHAHDYERFTPMDGNGNVDIARGIREFVVGTGGATFTGIGVRQPNSEVLTNSVHGILKLMLSQNSYTWEFLPSTGSAFFDSGQGTCF